MALPAHFQSRSQLRLPLWSSKQSLRQRPQIKPRSTGHNWQPSSPRNLSQRCPRLPAVPARGKGFIGIGNIDQVVWRARPLFD